MVKPEYANNPALYVIGLHQKEILIDKKEESITTDLPLGTTMHNIEITREKDEQLARAVDSVAKLTAREGKSAILRLLFGNVRSITKNCLTIVGQVGNAL